MEKVLYIGYYDKLRNGEQIRNYSLAAAKKMEFVFDSITKLGYQVDIISPSFIKVSDDKKVKESRETLTDNVDLVLTPSWGAKNKLSRIARVLYSKWWLFWYLIQHTKKDAPVLVYHNYALALPVVLAQKIKRFRLLLEIEEQYSMVWKLSRYQKWKENLLLKQGGDGCLVVSELLAEKLGIDNPIISYGSYNIYKGKIPIRSYDDKIVLVYTGSIDKVKGSAFIAIEAMEFLPEQYELKISGPLTTKDQDSFFEAVRQVNQRLGREAVTYLGLLDDDDYVQLLLLANIALNPQKEGGFGRYLFPSKILTYISYGIPVVSTKGESIVKSKISDLILFADDFNGRAVADAILSVQPKEPNEYLSRLDVLSKDFLKRLDGALKKEDVYGE